MRWRLSAELPAIERTAEVGRPIAEVYAAFRNDQDDDEPNAAVLLVRAEPPRDLEWELNMRGLRQARLRVTLDGAGADRTRVTSRFEARVVGRLRFRRAQLAEAYAAVVEGLLERTCASLDDPPEPEEPTAASEP